METPNDQFTSETLQIAEQLLSDKFGGSVELNNVDLDDTSGSPRSKVYRFKVNIGPDGMPPSVVVKRIIVRANETYNVNAAEGPAWRLFNEWAGLQFLTEILGYNSPAPQFYGGSREKGLVVMEDLGNVQDESLFGNDAEKAKANLINFAETAGRLHASTIGKKVEYDRIRNALGPKVPNFLSVVLPPDPNLDIKQKLMGWLLKVCDVADVKPYQGFEKEIEEVANRIAHPGPFEAFTHGDLCPGLGLLIGNTRKFIDFEIGDIRNALMEGICDGSIGQGCGRGDKIPEPILMGMRDAYRKELAKGCPEAEDDTIFNPTLVSTCAYRSCFHLQRMMEGDILRTDKQYGNLTCWQRILKTLDVLVRSTGEFSYLEVIGSTAHDMKIRLSAHWSSQVLQIPFFPAFQATAERKN